MAENVQQESAFEEMSYADQAMDYNDLIQENVFFGEMSLQVIIEGITSQFENYINTEDQTNYVDAFFNQYHQSLNQINTIDSDDHPAERKEVLDGILNEFISTIHSLFQQSLNVTIIPIDDGSTDINDIEVILRKLYEYFILNARKNFITALSGDILKKLPKSFESNKEFISSVNGFLGEYSPIIITMTIEDFLNYTGQDDIIEMISDNKWTGNFLKKYSPKLYQNEDLVSDIISNIAIISDLKEEMNNG